MPDELKKLDAVYADHLKDLMRMIKDKGELTMLSSNIISGALIKMGLKQTARQFNKLIQKI